MIKRFFATAVALVAMVLVVAAADAPKDTVELQGKIGCAHCNYHKGSDCGVGLKTADGKIYVLEKASKELMDARFEGSQLKVKGTVSEKDGTLYVNATSAELVK